MKSLFQYWLSVLIWAMIIFTASANLDLYKVLLGRWNEPCFSAEIQSFAEMLGRFINTTEYAVLAALIAREMIRQGDIHHSNLVIVLEMSELFVLSDKIHQLYVPGRTFQLMDLVLDLFGVVIGLILYAMIRKNRSIHNPNICR